MFLFLIYYIGVHRLFKSWHGQTFCLGVHLALKRRQNPEYTRITYVIINDILYTSYLTGLLSLRERERIPGVYQVSHVLLTFPPLRPAILKPHLYSQTSHDCFITLYDTSTVIYC